MPAGRLPSGLVARRMEAPSETTILTATIAVLQDMEFNVDRIEKPLGVITASKVSDADDAGVARQVVAQRTQLVR